MREETVAYFSQEQYVVATCLVVREEMGNVHGDNALLFQGELLLQRRQKNVFGGEKLACEGEKGLLARCVTCL